MKIEEIKAKYAILNDAASDKKKRYEVHYGAQDAKGNFFNLVKEAVCKPGELKAILKKFESEQKAKGNKIISELYRKSFAADAVSVNDKYDLGLNVNKNVPNAPVKVLTVTTKKEQDGVSGTVKFSKGGKNYAERFMVYSSGNWDVKPISNPGMNYSAGDREALMNAVRNKLSALGIKAK